MRNCPLCTRWTSRLSLYFVAIVVAGLWLVFNSGRDAEICLFRRHGNLPDACRFFVGTLQSQASVGRRYGFSRLSFLPPRPDRGVLYTAFTIIFCGSRIGAPTPLIVYTSGKSL